MSKVIQIRDVPDSVHAALVEAAEAEGVSLTGYLRRELAWLACRPVIARHNLDVITATRGRLAVQIDGEAILKALAEGRAER